VTTVYPGNSVGSLVYFVGLLLFLKPIPCHLNYCSFVVILKFGEHKFISFVFFKILLTTLGYLHFHINIQISTKIYWGFYLNSIESADQFGKGRGLKNIE
jgi:hypothetical protein